MEVLNVDVTGGLGEDEVVGSVVLFDLHSQMVQYWSQPGLLLLQQSPPSNRHSALLLPSSQ